MLELTNIFHMKHKIFIELLYRILKYLLSLKWVKFVIKFKEIVDNDFHLKSSQKLHYLQQHISGIAKRTMLGFSNEEAFFP